MNKTGKGGFRKGISGNPAGRPKGNLHESPKAVAALTAFVAEGDALGLRPVEGYEPVGSLTVESRKYAGLPLRTLAEIARNGRSDTARISASTALLDRGFGRPAQSVDLNLTADAVSKRLSELSDAELAALEARMVALPATLALQASADDPDEAVRQCGYEAETVSR
jgi:hypothetical protein